MAVIKTRNLSYTYPGGAKPALKEVTITIESGEFVIITGPSGCGKTTLCRCFNGLIPHFYTGKLEGKLEVAGLQVVKHPIAEFARHVGLVFQNPENQLFTLSVEKDVAFGLENLGTPREIIKEKVNWALRMTGIANLRERVPHELSGGQQQRVAIACVLAMQPKVIVLDEPTSFLDPLGAQKIFEVIESLNKKLGITVVLVEHRLDLASKYANHVIVMNEGKVALDGEPKEVFASEKAQMIGVGIPKSTKLYHVLKKMGVNLNRIPVTSEEASEIIMEVFGD